VSCVDEVQLLVLLVGGIRVVVLADEAIAGIPSGVGVDTEGGDPEVIADGRPLRIGVSDVGGWDVGQRGVSSGHGGDSSGHTAPGLRGLARARSAEFYRARTFTTRHRAVKR
jgi:hypothetical protein